MTGLFFFLQDIDPENLARITTGLLISRSISSLSYSIFNRYNN